VISDVIHSSPTHLLDLLLAMIKHRLPTNTQTSYRQPDHPSSLSLRCSHRVLHYVASWPCEWVVC